MTDPKNGSTAIQPRCAGGCGELVSAEGEWCAGCWPEYAESECSTCCWPDDDLPGMGPGTASGSLGDLARGETPEADLSEE